MNPRRRELINIRHNDYVDIEYSNRNIGIYLQCNETKEKNCASDRIRGEWIAKNSETMELYSEGKNYQTIIFHIASYAIHKISAQIKLLDICDKVWEYNVNDFLKIISPIQAIIVPTQILKSELSKITDKKIYVIEDGHDFKHYNNRIKNTHSKQAKEAVWFGYSENADTIAPFINYIKSSGIKLKVISQNQNVYPLEFADKFIKWDIDTYIQEISKSDFSILPVNKNYKSDNKEITSLLCGIPVAKTKKDISRFLHQDERKKEMEIKNYELEKYNIRYRVEKYMAIINDLRMDLIPVFTAISGKYDKQRNDIQVFSESTSDKFKLPVMNAKIYKVLSHKYFSNPVLIYIDGNIFLNVNPQKLIDEFLKNADMAIFKHPSRKCIYQEHIPARNRLPVEYKPLIDKQIIDYKKEGMPENFGLAECGMMIQRNNDIVKEFKEQWWAEICRYTNRDQISFAYIWWKMKDRIKINIIDGNVRTHKYFKYIDHQ